MKFRSMDEMQCIGGSNAALHAEFQSLWRDARALWDKHENSRAFGAYVSADYEKVFEALTKLQGRATTFLEWGSGLGVVAIMASRMGFESYGIEAEDTLVEFSRTLSQSYRSEARFAQGSFIPDEFDLNPSEGDDVVRTAIDMPSGYHELDMELRDFDLVYAYPWPDEHHLYYNILREHGRSGALYLSFDVREGMQLMQVAMQS